MTSTLLFPSESLTIDEAAELAKEGALLSRISVDDVRRVVPYLERARARTHALLAQEGSEDRGVFLILSGTARLCRSGVDLGSIGKGSHFGTLGRPTSPPARASVIAESPIELAWLRPERYEQLCHDDAMLALRVAEALAEAIQGELTVMTDNVGLLLRERTLPRHVFVDVTVGNAWQRVRTGTPLASLLPAEIGGDRVVAALVNNKAVALAMPVLSDAHIEPLLASHWEGKRVYRSSLGLLLLEAARRVDPRATVRLGPSIGFGQPVEVMGANGLPVTTWVERVEGMMRELVTTNFALRQELWTVDEARSHFAELKILGPPSFGRRWRAGYTVRQRIGTSLSTTPMDKRRCVKHKVSPCYTLCKKHHDHHAACRVPGVYSPKNERTAMRMVKRQDIHEWHMIRHEHVMGGKRVVPWLVPVPDATRHQQLPFRIVDSHANKRVRAGCYSIRASFR